MAAPSTEQRELQLVDSVDFKILGVANKEEKLHQLLQRFLAPLLLKAASEHASVRTKVFQILGRLKTFVRPPSIVLPVKELLKQYKSSQSPVVKQLDLSFANHSLDRLDAKDKMELIPIALEGLAAEGTLPSAACMLNIVLRLLLDLEIPPRGSKEDSAFREAIGLSDSADAEYLANAIGIFFRLRTPREAQALTLSNPSLSQQELALFTTEKDESEKLFKRSSQLKAKLVAFLASGAFTDKEKFLPALYAASGPDKRAASAAEEILKRSLVSLEDESLVQRLFRAHSVSPAAGRSRILGMLSKSTVSTRMPDRILDVVEVDLDTDESAESWRRPTSVLEQTRLHTALFVYLSWVARIGPSRPPFTVGRPLIRYMQSYIEKQGWPLPLVDTHDAVYLRSKAYETLGSLARTADLIVTERLDVGDWLFQSLSEDFTNDAVVSIDGALSTMSASIPPSIGGTNASLKRLLLMHMTLPDGDPAVRSTRHAAVKWANQCLPFSDILGRWIDILATAARPDERSDVVEQGAKGLDPWARSWSEEASPLPDWKDMVATFCDIGEDPNSRLFKRINEPSSDPTPSPYDSFCTKRRSIIGAALRYCRLILFLTALDGSDHYPTSIQVLERQVRQDIPTRLYIREYLKFNGTSVSLYLRSCLWNAKNSPSITEDCMDCFTDVASLSPRDSLASLVDGGFSSLLLQLVESRNKKISTLAARAVGMLIAHPGFPAEDFDTWCFKLPLLITEATRRPAAEMDSVEGGLMALSHLNSRAVYYDREFPKKTEYPFYLLVDEYLSSSLYETALYSFSELWTARLAMPPADSVEKIVGKLTAQAKKGREKAVVALGRLSIGLEAAENTEVTDARGKSVETGTSVTILDTILDELFSLYDSGQAELQFSVGDAISCVAARWQSNTVAITMDVVPRNDRYFAPARSSVLEAVIGRLLRTCMDTKPSLLRSASIWLLCLIMNCSHLDPVQSRLREVQAAFMRLLAVKDEVVQETASRGLTLVYERGQGDLKASLVKDLVSAFTGSGTQLKVGEDTELFDPGALPTGEGKSVTSYKDIVALANEAGDQRLVYKFMSLAADAATWSTRSAFGRFGLSSILSEADMDPKLYMKLYRYRFDPNPNVQRSMDAIWKAVVKDPNATLDKHFGAIMEDLLKSQLGREWRVREASCAALSSLISGRPFAQYGKYYRDVWKTSLKVLDDVKGSVREAARRLCMNLSNGVVRQLEEGNQSSVAKSMMREALPFLLSDKGMESTVKEVRIFATMTVLGICKKGGDALRPFIPEMMTQLLGLLSTIEPQEINYHYQRVGEDGRDEIDRLRSQMVNQSPISEAIDDMLRFVDADVMAELGPHLEDTIKSAVGMPTKIGCSRVLTTLATRHTDLSPWASRFLKLLRKQVLDKNDEVSQAYARAAAYLWRKVSDKEQMEFCEAFFNKYLAAEDERRRQKIADVILALAKISPDVFTANEVVILPFVYLGRHDTDEYTAKMFDEAWSQHAGSGRTVMRYVTEIVALVEKCVEATQWSLRHTAAFTVAAMIRDVAKATDATGGISESMAGEMWPALCKTLALKTFPGKEKLLESFCQFVEQGRALWGVDEDVAMLMTQIAVREAKRNNDEYRVHAFRCLRRYSKARDDLDMSQQVEAITKPYEDKMEVD
ncbi:proteasome component ECM29 [Ophiocordyceps camponoti-floridani]|uniref:Proteasome component ECM29 n=1 Tax=Ophiocordyceps camponoti-floridani TaxID=2030778 RepID=A0A8H4Q8G6_9HYPO|nr:proteasome component ECM29 [Ophiocordyceps camponoti-floridani]